MRNPITLITFGYRGAGIVLTAGNEVLLQLRKHPRVWAFIGGGMKKGETFLETALREFYEETGIKLSSDMVDKKPLHQLGFWHYKWVLYHCHLSNEEKLSYAPKEFSDEYIKYRYVDIKSYREEIRKEKHHHFFFFVKHQMKLLNRRMFDNNR